MPRTLRSALVLVALAAGLSGCGTVNEKLSAGMRDYVPQWAGGLPADAPPRPGTPQYDAYMKERERNEEEGGTKSPGHCGGTRVRSLDAGSGRREEE
jgi:hypothetical protein